MEYQHVVIVYADNDPFVRLIIIKSRIFACHESRLHGSRFSNYHLKYGWKRQYLIDII